jgi:HD-GYP domain
LTPEEWSIMKKHSEIGYRITQSSRELAHVSEAVLGHHEWWNGKGYPQGLKEDEIPLFSRIVSIVDSYDVITHERPYKRAMDPYSALVEINKCAGKQFDPYLVTVFNKIMQESLVVNDR